MTKYKNLSDMDIMILLNNSMRTAMSEPDPDRSIQKLLEFWGRELGSARTYIFEERNGLYDNSYEWCAENVRPEIDHLQGIPKDMDSIWVGNFEKYGYDMVKDVESLKDSDPEIYAVLKSQELSSLITCPIYHEGKMIGMYGVDNPPPENMDNLTSVLPIIGNFLDSLIIRRDLMKELEKLSFYDELTGLGNKNAMHRRKKQLSPEQSCALVFADVCGLKRVNDTMGHLEGDRLLKAASECLISVFGKDSVYRVGGDEFIVLLANVGKSCMEEKTELLRKESREKSAPLAVGYSWREKTPDSLDEMIENADELMYQDKKMYYEELGHIS